MTSPDNGEQLSREDSLLALDTLEKSATVALSDVTDRVRQLSLAGIAIVWLFKEGSLSSIVLPPSLLWALTFLVCALMLDFFHCVVTVYGWWRQIRYLTGKETIDPSEEPMSGVFEDVRLPYRVYRRPRTTWPVAFLKSGAVAFAYCLIGLYLARRLLG